MSIYNIIRLFLLCLVLSACTNAGKGQITMSERSAVHFEEYLQDRNSEDFYLSQDGLASFSTYCPHDNCRRTPAAEVLQACQKTYFNKEKAPCGLFMRPNSLSWESPGNFMPFQSAIVKEKLGNYFVDPSLTYNPSGVGPILFGIQSSIQFNDFLKTKGQNLFYITLDGEGTMKEECDNQPCTLEDHKKNIKKCEELYDKRCLFFADRNKIFRKKSGNFMTVN